MDPQHCPEHAWIPRIRIRNTASLYGTYYSEDPATCIGVHCVTGLGRAPVLVAVALIELGMKYEVSSHFSLLVWIHGTSTNSIYLMENSKAKGSGTEWSVLSFISENRALLFNSPL
jgi:hypothetical protein